MASPFRNRADDGALIGPFNALLHAPEIGTSFIEFHEAEERVTPLSARMRGVIILSVGAAWRCAYAHRAVATKIGFASDVVTALAHGVADPSLSAEERAVQRFTLELASDERVSDQTYAECETILGRDALVAVVLLAAAYAGTCTILNAFEAPAPETVAS